MVEINIVPSEVSHIRKLSDTLRKEDKQEATRLGLSPLKVLYYSYKHAVYRKTALAGDTVLAMWGVCGVPFGLIGTPYLLTSEAVKSVSSIRFARIYMNEMKIMSRLFPILENYADPSYITSTRMMELAGFKLEDPVLIDNHLFQKFSVGAV